MVTYQANGCVGTDTVSATASFGGSSFDVVHRVFRGETLAIEGFETRVWAGPDPDKPGAIKGHKIPAEVIAAFNR